MMVGITIGAVIGLIAGWCLRRVFYGAQPDGCPKCAALARAIESDKARLAGIAHLHRQRHG